MDDMDWILNVNGGANRTTALQFQKLGTSPEEVFPATRDRNGYIDADLPTRIVSGITVQATNSPLDGIPMPATTTRPATRTSTY
jgi:hypothetical protein